MIRRVLVLAALPLLLLGCGRSEHPAYFSLSSHRSAGVAGFADVASVPEQDKPALPGNVQLFSYNHTLEMIMPRAGIEPRYQSALARCEHDAALHCRLEEASLNKTDDGASASFTVAMPHSAIETFEHALEAPVAGEQAGDAKVTSRATAAANVTQQSGDATRKVAQLKDYRDRLAALAARKDLRVDDLIKVAGELSSAQSALDDAASSQQDIADRVARERLTVSLAERPAAPSVVNPIGEVWHSSVELLAQSTADVLEFLILVVPWIPVAIGALFLLRWLWRIARRRPAIALSRPDKTPEG